MAAPETLEELLQRAGALAGERLGALARRAGLSVPGELRRHKGFAGALLERLLGASAASRAEPDFPALGVELKTLPVNARGRPVESTFVCTIPLARQADLDWENSWVRAKLARVLFVPVLGERRVPVPERVVGQAFLWTPDQEEERWLRDDWEEFAQRIARGDAESLHGRLGRVLQVRPKAANSRSRARGVDEDGLTYPALPRGFYLRATFTAAVLARHLVLPRG